MPETDGVPPGWSDWYGAGNAHPSYDYTLNENGRIVAYGREPDDYLNDVLTRKAVAVIEDATAAGQPFFLYVSTLTPHSPAASPPRTRTSSSMPGCREGRRSTRSTSATSPP